MKTNDIYISSFPKSGTTYFSFLLAAARLRHSGMAMVPTLFNIDYLVIDTHKMTGVPAGSIWHDGIGDFYKTHSPYFQVPNFVYVLRNPIDTLRSYFHMRRQLGSTDTVMEYLNGPEGVGSWIHHVKSWLLDNRSASQSVFVTEYEALLADPRAELCTLGAQLGIEFSAATIEFAIGAASIERMRTIEDAFAARNPVFSQFNLEFVRKTQSRQVGEFTPELISAIEAHTRPVYELIKSRLRG